MLSLIVIIFLVLFNAIFATGEMAFISVRPLRLQQLKEEGVRGSTRALRLSKNPQIFLPTVQVGMTLVSILEGTFGGVQLERILTPWLEKIPLLHDVAGQISMFVVVMAITALMLVFGELVPKQFALREPERVSCWLALPLEWLALIAKPAVWCLQLSSRAVLKVMGVGDSVNRNLTEEEIKAYIAEGARLGVLENKERNMIDRLLRLADRSVRAIMTPRNEICWIERSAPQEELVNALRRTHFSRIVVCQDRPDNPVGLLLVKDMLDRVLEHKNVSIEAGIRPIVVVPDSMSALDVLERMRTIQLGMVFVLDEYGVFEGIVTSTDIFDAIIGEGKKTNVTQDSPQHERGVVMMLEGTTSIDEVRDLLRLKNLPQEGTYYTLGGMILALLRRVPRDGDKVVWGGWLFEVMGVRRRRVVRVRASRQVFAEN